MIKEVQMPKLGQTVEEATIETWHRTPGDAIEKGEPLLDITTDKATLEVEAFVSGTVQKTLFEPGEVVPVNAVIAFIGDEEPGEEQIQKAKEHNEKLAAGAKPEAATATRPEPAAAPQAAPAQPTPAPAATPASAAAPAPPLPSAAPAAAPPPGRLFASPRARRVAKEEHVPIQILRGSGPNGRIVEADVLDYAQQAERLPASPTARVLAAQQDVDITRLTGSGVDGRIMRADVEAAPAAPPAYPVPLTAMRRVVAERLTYSKQTTPHFYLTTDVDMTDLVALRKELNAQGGPKISFNDLTMRAVVLAFETVPKMNVAWADGALLYRREVNLGLAVSLEEGLIVPVVRNCERKSLTEIAEASADLVERARSKRLSPDDYEGGGFTLSNVGMFGIDSVAPIINPGEVAILGIGRIAPKPVVIDEGIHIRQTCTFALASDHRIVDGALAAEFFKALKDALEEPQRLT